MATFSELKTRVQRWVIDLPSAVNTEVPDLLNDALRDIQDTHNFKVMESLGGPYSTTQNSHTLTAVPSDFKEFRDHPYYEEDLGRVRMMRVSYQRDEAAKAFGEDTDRDIGEPKVLLDAEPTNNLNARSWEVYPFPDGASDYSNGEYRIFVPYWRYLPALSADGDSNWFTVNASLYLIFKAVSEAFFLNWDEERGAVFQQKATQQMRRAVMTDKHYKLGAVETLVPYKNVNASKLRF